MKKKRYYLSTERPSACSSAMAWGVLLRFPNFAISDCGDVVNIKRDKRLRGSLDSDGYIVYSILDEFGEKVKISAHRLVALCFLDHSKIKGQQVAHINGSRLNSHFGNLRWSTSLDNHADRKRHGTGPIGEKNPTAKLTEIDVRRIRELREMVRMRETKLKVVDIARMYGIHPATVSNIVSGKAWGHIR